MRNTEDPVAYTFSNPDAKKLLYLLEDSKLHAYEQARVITQTRPETFRRLTRRMAQLNLIRMRAPRGAEFEGRAIRVIIEASPRGRKLIPVLHQLDEVLIDNKDRVGAMTLRNLSAVA